jgi:hypothetical protein
MLRPASGRVALQKGDDDEKNALDGKLDYCARWMLDR